MSTRKTPQWVVNLGNLLTNPKVVSMLVVAFGGGGATGTILAGDSMSPIQVDSAIAKRVAPIVVKQARQDTALITIYFRLEVMMTEEEKRRADSLMRAAFRNINYGGSP